MPDLEKLILIIPVYNGEKILPGSFRILKDFFIDKNYPVKICFVDDGSSDASNSLLVDYQKSSHLDINVISIPRNSGKGMAIKTAIAYILDNDICREKDIIAFTDADLPYGLAPLEAARRIFLKNSETNLIIGNRNLCKDKKNKQYSVYRRFFKVFFAKFLPSKIKKYTDTQSGLKVFNKKIAAHFKLVKTSGWCFDLELLLIAVNNNYTIVEMPVELKKVHFFGGVSLMKHGFKIMRDLIHIGIREKRGLYRAS